MKRAICLILLAVLAFSLAACDESPDLRDPVSFYYCRSELDFDSEQGFLAPEHREAFGHHEDLPYLLDQYFKGPLDSHLISPFPPGTAVVSLRQEGSVLKITLERDFARLTGLHLTVACASLTLTCLDLTDASAVEISARDAMLDGANSVTMARDSIRLVDDQDMSVPAA